MLNTTSLSGPNVPPQPLLPEDRARSFLSAYDSASRWNFQLASYNPDHLLLTKGYEQMDDMLTMACYASPLALKRYATLYKPWKIRPKLLRRDDPNYARAIEVAEFVNYALTNIRHPVTNRAQDFREVLWNTTEAFHIGFSVQEKIWRVYEDGPYKGKWGLQRIVPKRPRQIGFYLDRDTLELNLIRSWSPGVGFQIGPVEKFILYTYNSYAGLPYGRGDCRPCYKHVYCINELLRLLGIALELHGVPYHEFQVPAGATEEMIQKVFNLARDIRQGAPCVLLEGIEHRVHMPASNTLDSFLKAIELHHVAIIESILGQSLTMLQGHRSGSYSLGEVHNETQGYFLSFCRRDIEEVFTNDLIRQLVVYNFPEEYHYLSPSLFLGDYDMAERQMIADFLARLVQTGVLSPDEPVIRDEVGLPPRPETDGGLTQELATRPTVDSENTTMLE